MTKRLPGKHALPPGSPKPVIVRDAADDFPPTAHDQIQQFFTRGWDRAAIVVALPLLIGGVGCVLTGPRLVGLGMIAGGLVAAALAIYFASRYP